MVREPPPYHNQLSEPKRQQAGEVKENIMNQQCPLISMRLSNGRDHSVPFAARSEAAFITECQAAWRGYRAQLASVPGFFEAQQQFNDLREKLQPDLDGRAKAAKIVEWCQRGHSPESAEILWGKLVDNRRAQLSNAKRRLKAHMLPDYLELHVSSIALPGKHWFNPATAVCGVRIYADMRIEARTHVGLRLWSWGELWSAVNRVIEYERQLLGLGDWMRGQVEDFVKPSPPRLTLVKGAIGK
jgi:hypothetical protein